MYCFRNVPKFKLEPPTLSLVEALQTLGMKSAFTTNANFNRTAFLRREQGLYISGIFQKTFLQVDEAGTEASAATGVARGAYGGDTNVPVQVRIDRPFLFMIQHRPTGRACSWAASPILDDLCHGVISMYYCAPSFDVER